MPKTKIATVDCETDPFLYNRFPKPFTWGFYDGEKYIDFWGDDATDKMIEHIEKFNGIVYAHNGGKFDFHYLITKAAEKGKIKIINGRIAEYRLGKARLRDSWLILPVSLKQMQKDDIEYWKMEKEHRQKYKYEIPNIFENK